MEALSPGMNIQHRSAPQMGEPVRARVNQVAREQLQAMLPEIPSNDIEAFLRNLFAISPSHRSFEAYAAVVEARCGVTTPLEPSAEGVVEAARKGDYEWLYQPDVNLDRPNADGEFPLTAAAATDPGRVTGFLIAHCDPFVENMDRRRAIDVARWAGYIYRSLAIRESMRGKETLEFGFYLRDAIGNKNMEEVKHWLRKGAPIGQYDALGENALHKAARAGNTDILRMLLDQDRNVLDARASRGGSTPLHIAAECGHWGCVQVLLESGADLTLVDEHGLTPRNVSALAHLDEEAPLETSTPTQASRMEQIAQDVMPEWEDDIEFTPQDAGQEPPLARRRTGSGEARNEAKSPVIYAARTPSPNRRRWVNGSLHSDDIVASSSPSPDRSGGRLNNSLFSLGPQGALFVSPVPLREESDEDLPPTARVESPSRKRKSPAASDED